MSKMSCSFRNTEASLSEVLPLMVGLALPLSNEESTKDVLDTCACLRPGLVRDEPVHRSSLANNILQGVDKLGLFLHSDDIADIGAKPDKELGAGFSAVDRRCVREDCIRGNILVALADVGPGMLCLVVVLKEVTLGCPGQLCGLVKGTLDSVHRLPSKQGSQ